MIMGFSLTMVYIEIYALKYYNTMECQDNRKAVVLLISLINECTYENARFQQPNGHTNKSCTILTASSVGLEDESYGTSMVTVLLHRPLQHLMVTPTSRLEPMGDFRRTNQTKDHGVHRLTGLRSLFLFTNTHC